MPALLAALAATALVASSPWWAYSEITVRPGPKPEPQPDPLEEVLDALAQCESSGNPEAVNDAEPNGWRSRGLYQWQVPSVQDVHRRWWGREVSTTTAIAIAHDPVRSRELAREALRRGEWWHWRVCSRKLGIPEKLAELAL